MGCHEDSRKSGFNVCTELQWPKRTRGKQRSSRPAIVCLNTDLGPARVRGRIPTLMVAIADFGRSTIMVLLLYMKKLGLGRLINTVNNTALVRGRTRIGTQFL